MCKLWTVKDIADGPHGAWNDVERGRNSEDVTHVNFEHTGGKVMHGAMQVSQHKKTSVNDAPLVVSMSVDDEHYVHIWDNDEHKVLLDGQDGAVTCCALKLDVAKVLIFTGSDDSVVRLWSSSLRSLDKLGSKRPVLLEGHSHAVTHVEISRDAEYALSSALDGSCRIWDCARHVTVRVLVSDPRPSRTQLASPRAVTQCTFQYLDDESDRPTMVASINSTDSGSVACIFSVQSGETIQQIHGHTKHINALAIAKFSSGQQFIITGSDDATLQIAEIHPQTGGESVQTLEHDPSNGKVTAVAITGNLMVTGLQTGKVRLWNLGSDEKFARVWPEEGDEGNNYQCHSGAVNHCQFSYGAQWGQPGKLLTCSDDHSIRIWELSASLSFGKKNTVQTVDFGPENLHGEAKLQKC